VRVLVVNAGSSSLKLRVLGGDDELLGERDLDAPRSSVDGDELFRALRDLPDADAAGHRIVHGGTRFREAVRVDDSVVAALHELTDLAPLHQPKSLAALEATTRALPRTPAVACFDTAFHATLSPAAATYALPAQLRERFGVRRYGFHGLSHAYAARRVAELAPAATRVVTCHLGAGASLAAVRDGRSIDTTMGFTPLEGLVMATRSGSVDPGLVLWLLEHGRMQESELAAALEHDSGLLGLAGSADMRELLAREDGDARLALDVYVHRLRAGIAAMAAALGGLDALVFTGGVGEHSPEIRARAVDGLGFLGAALDPERNRRADGDDDIGASGAQVRAFAIAAREDLEIARQVRAVLSK
jgi:acetate kinase